MTSTLARELAPSVRVNAIMPGVFRTAMNEKLLDGTPRGQEFLMRTPMKRFGRVEELVPSAIFLASEGAGYITGQNIRVDGGVTRSV